MDSTNGVSFIFTKTTKEKTIDDVFKAHWRVIVYGLYLIKLEIKKQIIRQIKLRPSPRVQVLATFVK
jgi:hypothetical protein